MAAGAVDHVQALKQAYADMGRVLEQVGSDELGASSQCEGWDLRTMLNHAFGTGWMFTLVNQGQSVGEDAGDVVGDDPATACAELAAANLAAWSAPGALEGERTYPFGTFPAPMALLINIGEIQVHAWDVAKSTGQDLTIDPDVAALLLDFYGSLPLDAFREKGAFGAEVPIPESAPAADRMLGLIGFQP